MPTTPTVWLTTLGCAKNQVDSEKVEVMLGEAGYRLADSPDSADVVMVNTCAFIEEAREESVDTILEMQETKRSDAHTIVIGCMAQRFGTDVAEALPEVDAILGLDRYGELVGTLDRLTGFGGETVSGTVLLGTDIRRRPKMDILNVVNRPAPSFPYAYVKVAEGCDKPCTFCAIPLIRGKQRSRRPTEIRDEVSGLVAAGVKEIVLVAQDLAAYGRDIDAPGAGIVDLLRFCSDVEGLDVLRLLYLYPKEIRPALIEEIATNPKVATYFDLSLQHASVELLRAMRRPGGAGRYVELLEQIRSAAPDAATRSSFIVGFPGETEAQVEELAEFLEVARLDWAGFFPYSPEPGTPAAELDGRIDREEINERLRYLQSVQEDITYEANSAMVGTTVAVLVDQIEDDVAVGRSWREAPEIDGVITLDGGAPGDWVEATITAVVGTDLEATVRV
ncbi:MAG TPA: 30S ribosomal protein S12 methylthiotransferase RimO [Acidimicrobiia bacterium]|jgi:ribosomal protein S12 methylthiotransferase RimO